MKLGKPRAKPSKSPRIKRKAAPAKPRGELLLDRIDKNPKDREAWNELASGVRKPRRSAVKRKTK